MQLWAQFNAPPLSRFLGHSDWYDDSKHCRSLSGIAWSWGELEWAYWFLTGWDMSLGALKTSYPWVPVQIGEIIAVRILFDRITYKAWVSKLRPARLYYAARSSICELRICYNPIGSWCEYWYCIFTKGWSKMNEGTKSGWRWMSSTWSLWSTVLFEMIVGVLTTCHTQYTWDSSM